VLAGHAAFANTRGIRHIVNWHPDLAKTYVSRPDLLTDPAWLAGFALLRKYGLSFDLQLYPSQMADAARLAARHPDTLIILNHAGMPVDRDAEAIALWRRGMGGLAAAPNVLVKISGLGMVDWHWTEASIRPFVLETIEIFGVGRSMFASNFPVDRLYSSFDTLYRAFKNIVADFQPAERRKLFHDNATAAYRL
jgi:predicted TIM-barrel fold metal-dependent hydrolase